VAATKRTYEQWLVEVDKHVQIQSGGELYEQDLPDWDSYDAYREGVSPARAARKALKEAEAI
jgi:exonuclease VII small subunit